MPIARTAGLLLSCGLAACAALSNPGPGSADPAAAPIPAATWAEPAEPALGPLPPLVAGASGELSDEELAKKLNNPVASLVSVPIQFDHDENYGPNDDGKRSVLSVEPVIPIALTERWNLISRTNVPLVDQDDIPTGKNESGLGDITQSFFLTPKETPEGGWIWGAGPVVLIPSATNPALGQRKFGLGPTAVFLKQQGGWTTGALVNQLWTIAGDIERTDVNSTFLQPFVAYTTPRATTFTLNSESTYDWQGDRWSIPINAVVSQIVKIGGARMSLFAGARYWAESPDGGPEGMGFRVGITLLFPE